MKIFKILIIAAAFVFTTQTAAAGIMFDPFEAEQELRYIQVMQANLKVFNLVDAMRYLCTEDVDLLNSISIRKLQWREYEAERLLWESRRDYWLDNTEFRDDGDVYLTDF